MILLIDNYDSFSYNLYQLVGAIEPDIKVIRNDEMTVEEIERLAPDRIILSPGPGRPEDAGIIMEVAGTLGKSVPILGVCLGHQAICAAFGATVTYAKELMHGKQSVAEFDTDCPLFAGCPKQAPVARYHSLAAAKETIPDCLKVTAVTLDGEVMAVQHKEYPIYGVLLSPLPVKAPRRSTAPPPENDAVTNTTFTRPYFLAGGLDCSNVTQAVKTLAPYALDVSSGIETQGYKDLQKMRDFVHKVRHHHKQTHKNQSAPHLSMHRSRTL